MQRAVFKHITTLLFLVAFLVPRVVELHAFEHISDNEDQVTCELCDITTQVQEQELTFGQVSHTYQILSPSPSDYVITSSYGSPVAYIVTPTVVYNKPPPFLLG